MENFGADTLVDLFRLIALRLAEARAELGALDGAIGDADHGNSMAEGFGAVVRAVASAGDAPPSDLLALAARSFLSAVGATTGPLYASALLAAAQDLRDKTRLTEPDIITLVQAFARGISQRGKANPGDKTMLDAWAPAARAAAEAERAGLPPAVCLKLAETAAREGRDATGAMIASLGRAARLGARSLGHIDPGAASAVVVIGALREWLDEVSRTAQGVT